MNAYVWPRLPLTSAEAILDEVVVCLPGELRASSSLSHPDAACVAVGGVHAPEEVVASLRSHLRELSDALGFPAPLRRNRVSDFDRRATRILHETMGIIPADAASAEVWSFLSLVVLPDVALWRFPGNARERLLGHPRNVFRRLWWRAETVGSDLIDTAGGLGEDELVNIMERPTLAANDRIASGLARVVVERGGSSGSARSELMRDAAKRVLRRQAYVCLDSLPDDLLSALLNDCLTDAIRSVSALTGPGKAG